MDRKSLIVLLLSFALLLTWPALVNKIFPPIPKPPPSTNTVATATNRLLDPINARAPARTNQGTISAAREPLPTFEGPEQLLVAENDHMRVTFTSHGGGIDLVEVKGYLASVDCKTKNGVDTNRLASLNTRAPRPAFDLIGPADNFGDDSSGVLAQKDLPSGLRFVKDYRLGTNYLSTVVLRFENPTDQPIALPAFELVTGTAVPMGDRDESMSLGFEWYDGEDTERITEAYFANRTLGCIPGQPRTEYRAGASNIVWSAVHNQFFAMIAVPEEPVLQIIGRRVALPPPSAEELEAHPYLPKEPFGHETTFTYPATIVPAHGSMELKYSVYAGPKEYYTLSLLPKNLDLVMGFGGWFGPFSKGLLLSMNLLHGAIVPSYGLSIIFITVIIKLLFWPLTQASTRSMRRMSELQPQMKALQEKYKDDPKKMNQKLMEFMKQNKVSPLGGCLPMLLQIPVFIGFYRMLQSAIELRGAEFLWICDLSQSDTIWTIPGVNFPLNPMPLLMGTTMLWQARMTPPSPGMDPVQQKIMKYMPLMFMVFLYNFSAGLTLYWTVQNLLTIAQMKLTKSRPNTPSAGDRPGAAPLAAAKPARKKR